MVKYSSRGGSVATVSGISEPQRGHHRDGDRPVGFGALVFYS